MRFLHWTWTRTQNLLDSTDVNWNGPRVPTHVNGDGTSGGRLSRLKLVSLRINVWTLKNYKRLFCAHMSRGLNVWTLVHTFFGVHTLNQWRQMKSVQTYKRIFSFVVMCPVSTSGLWLIEVMVRTSELWRMINVWTSIDWGHGLNVRTSKSDKRRDFDWLRSWFEREDFEEW